MSDLRASNQEVHRLRKVNAKLRDDYSRQTSRLTEVQLALAQYKRDHKQAELLKQKDYEYIIKQDRQLENYQAAYGKVVNRYNGKFFYLT
jgi:hypothetical protein